MKTRMYYLAIALISLLLSSCTSDEEKVRDASRKIKKDIIISILD